MKTLVEIAICALFGVLFASMFVDGLMKQVEVDQHMTTSYLERIAE